MGKRYKDLFARSYVIKIFLRSQYPKAFPKGGARPLAVGIRGSIVFENPEIDYEALRFFLNRYTVRKDYLAALEAGEKRVNLDGSTTADTPKSHRDFAASLLAEMAAS
jgi:sRNA-binding protein